MKILSKDVKHGVVVVLPEILDDLWALYNVILKGDKVFSRTTREIRVGDRYDRPEKGKRISVLLGINVEKVMWDKSLNRLRVHGIVSDAPHEIGVLGSRHTLNIDLNKALTIVKKNWMEHQLNLLDRAAEKGVPPITVISIDDEGYAIAVLRGFGLDVKAEEKASLPGKLIAEDRARALQDLSKSAARALGEVWAPMQNPIIIVGLGFVKNHFARYLEEREPKLWKNVIDMKSVNSSGLAGIYEALRSRIFAKTLKHLRITEETVAVEEVLRRLGKEKADVTYGLAEVERASMLGAVERLLLTDIQLRETSEEERTVLEGLMREVERKGGRVVIISTEHEAGVKLNSLGGIAALLRFPIA